MARARTIGCLLLKGGVSKTAVAVALASAGSYVGQAVLGDCDDQGSAADWARLAAAAGTPLPFPVAGFPQARVSLPRELPAVQASADLVVLDAPPPGQLADIRAVIAASDLVCMPVPPNPVDLRRVVPTIRLAREIGCHARAVLTQVRGGLAEAGLAREMLAEWGVPVYQTMLPLSVSVSRAYGAPLGPGLLLRFGLTLLAEIYSEQHIFRKG